MPRGRGRFRFLPLGPLATPTPIETIAPRGSELSARCAGNSETENGQEQGELRAAANKATMFQPVCC